MTYLRETLRLGKLAHALGKVERGVCHDDGRPESDTDHTVMLAWLACSLAEAWYPELDRGLIAQLALAHDACEAYAGDVYALTSTPEGRQAKARREEDAVSRIGTELPKLAWLHDMAVAYRLQAVPEARFVRVIDKVGPKVSLRISGRARESLRSHGVTLETARAFLAREDAEVHDYASDFPEALRLRDELHGMLRLEEVLAPDDRPAEV